MKRLGLIAIIAVVVLAMSAGAAFANVCVGPQCQGSMRCDLGGMPTHMGAMTSPTAAIQARCDMVDQHRSSDLSASQVRGEQPSAAVSASAPAVTPAAVRPGLAGLVPADARGAPHLTAVLRL